MNDKGSVSGKTVLLTGAASGIGRATALELARRGARLVLVDINAEGVAAVAQACGALGAAASHVVVDLGNMAAVDALVARAQDELGPIDVLINNAGVAVVGPFARTQAADWEWIFSINVLGPLRLTRGLLPAMLARGSGHVVIVASLAGLIGAPGMVAYSTTKFALVGFAESLRLELFGSGVGVTTVCPGHVRTNLHRATRYDNPGFRRFLDEAPSYYGMTAERVATRLVDAVIHRQPLVVLGPEKLGWWLKRLAPEVAFTVARWTARRANILGGPA
jgi:short-subunit dehydrogenase